MHLLFELIGFVFLFFLGLALIGFVLVAFGAVAFIQTHNPLYLISVLLGFMVISAMD